MVMVAVVASDEIATASEIQGTVSLQVVWVNATIQLNARNAMFTYLICSIL